MRSSVGQIMAGLLVACVPLAAQSVISAKAGLIHYLEGDAFLDDKTVQQKFGEFPEMKNGQTLRTKAGRAEVLLRPGTILRMAENSSVRMVSNSLDDTRIEVLSGSVLVEAAEVEKDTALRLLTQSSSVELRKKGLYRINAPPAELMVYDGEALVTLNGQATVVKDSRRTPLEGAIVTTKFDTKVGDPFYRWAGRRSGSLAAANIASAKSIYHSDLRWSRTGWVFNPVLGLYTYIPLSGSYFSPFGYRYYSPNALNQVLNPPVSSGGMGRGGFEPTFNPNLGYNTAARSVDSGSYSSATPAAAPAAAAPAGDGGGHVRGGGAAPSGDGRGR